MKKSRILIVLIILLLIILIMLTILSNIKKSTENEEQKKYLYPGNTMQLHFSYKGKVSLTDVYAELYNIVQIHIPAVYSEKDNLTSQKKIQKYYKKNKDINTVIYNDNDFNKLLDVLKKYNTEKLSFEHSEIVNSSCIISDNKTEFIIKIKYQNCEEIFLKIIILNEEINNSYIKFIPIVEE